MLANSIDTIEAPLQPHVWMARASCAPGPEPPLKIWAMRP
jgi:hypothetical protein